MNVLVCTLGASWQVVPEIFGFVAPDIVDLYQHHPARETLARLRADADIEPPHELWLCTTEGRQTRNSLESLRAWWEMVGAPLPLRVWQAEGTDQLASQAECEHMRELILRVTLRASEAGGALVLSLAGGRKTMSADLQWAGALFGARAWLHIVGPEPLPDALARNAAPDIFARPLPLDLAAAVMPLVVGRGRRDELLDVTDDGAVVSADRFPVPLADPLCRWPRRAGDPTLAGEIRRRQGEGARLFGNFLSHLAAGEHHENWRSLYRLPPAEIARLREARLGEAPRDHGWIEALPKADLHRHLGGCLDLDDQRAVGRAVWDALTTAERAAALEAARTLLASGGGWPDTWPNALRERDSHARAGACAALLVECDEDSLRRNLWPPAVRRVALKHTLGFAAYERPGELTGSAVLGHPAALEPYARALFAQAVAEGLAYVELRGSPHKYRPEDPAGFVVALRDALARVAPAAGNPRPAFRFVWIVDRRQRGAIAGIVRQAVAAAESLADFLVGLDLAGDEGTNRPEQLAPAFEPAFRACLPITIHAGEGEPAANIWEAAYRLHADRIGHGLTLLDDDRMLRRFRDRGICLELCPTSNREVVGFHDPAVPESAGMPRYPLRELMSAGLPVTIATDNPGISRTTLAGEFLAASRMASTPVTRWEVLALVKQGFARAFLPAAERERLLKRVDAEIYRRLT